MVLHFYSSLLFHFYASKKVDFFRSIFTEQFEISVRSRIENFSVDQTWPCQSVKAREHTRPILNQKVTREKLRA